jgi:scyllo-inositol 2-dehydrogenase (NADP+)
LLAADIDLVVISAPNSEHYPFARAALLAGKHVVLEKPFVNTVAEGQELIELAREKQLTLSVFHNRRWDGDFVTVRKLLTEGTLGVISHYESHFDRFRPAPRQRWKETPLPGSGLLYDLGSHLLDQALLLFGEPRGISATVQAQRPDSAVDDYFHLVLDYAPMQVILHASMLTLLPGPRFCIHGSQGSFVKQGLDPQEDRLKQGTRPDHLEWALESADCFGQFTGIDGRCVVVPTEVGGYQRYYQQLAQNILNGAPNPVPPEQALAVIRWIELAYQSAADRSPVRVPA